MSLLLRLATFLLAFHLHASQSPISEFDDSDGPLKKGIIFHEDRKILMAEFINVQFSFLALTGALFFVFFSFFAFFLSSLFFSFPSSFRFLCQARQHNTMMMVINTITTTPMMTAAEPVSLSDVSVAGVILHSGRDSLLKERRRPPLDAYVPSAQHQRTKSSNFVERQFIYFATERLGYHISLDSL